MKKFQFTGLIFTLFLAFFAVSCAGSKGEAEKTIESYVELLKAKNFARAWVYKKKDSSFELTLKAYFLFKQNYLN